MILTWHWLEAMMEGRSHVWHEHADGHGQVHTSGERSLCHTGDVTHLIVTYHLFSVHHWSVRVTCVSVVRATGDQYLARVKHRRAHKPSALKVLKEHYEYLDHSLKTMNLTDDINYIQSEQTKKKIEILNLQELDLKDSIMFGSVLRYFIFNNFNLQIGIYMYMYMI